MFANNPLPIQISHTDPRVNSHCNPDPYILAHDGYYYCYSTGWQGVNVLRSKDLQAFEHMGYALADDTQLAYWAPAVIYHQDQFLMYYSSIPAGQDDPHLGRLKVAVADNPLGPFTTRATLFADDFTIDADVVKKDGQLYLFYVAMCDDPTQTQGRIGVMIFMDKLTDPFAVAGAPRLIVAPTIDQEVFIKKRQWGADSPWDGRDWYTIEGPCYFAHEGTGYMLYSGNAFMHEDYFVGYATSDATVPLEDAVFRKYPSPDTYAPLIGRDQYFTGCGHNSVFKGLDGEWLIAYHGRDSREAPPEGPDDGRRLCIAKIEINDKKLKVVPRQEKTT